MSPASRIQFQDEEGSVSFHNKPAHRIRNFLRLIACVWLIAFASSVQIQAYTFISNPPTVWPDGTIPMDLQLGSPSSVLMDGNTSWNTVAENALATWNLYMNGVQFTIYSQSTGIAIDGNGRNEAQFNSSVYGKSFGSGVLAMTTTWVIGTRRTEGDTIFNSTVLWDSYRGDVKFISGEIVNDLQRVALHEFGHTLGLDHPDQAGQTVAALMNSHIGNLDRLTTDDTTGAAVLYLRVPPSAPTANAATSVTSGGFTANSSSASGAAGYRLDVSTSSTFSSYVSGYQNLDVGNVTTRSVSGLSAITPYYYRVRAYNSGGTSENSGAITATTLPNPPAAPTVNPATSLTVSGFTANWSSAGGATGYRLDVSANSAFNSYVSGYQNLDVANVTTRSVSGLSANTIYYYRVRAYNSGGISGNSGTITTTTLSIPPSITAQPKSRNVPASGNVTFNVLASGSQPLSYQWRHNGLNISSANNTSHTIFNVQTNHAGNYTVVVSNAGGTITSAVAVLNLSIPLPGTLFIANSGFEDPVLLADGQENGASGYTVPGWVETGETNPESQLWAWAVYNPDLADIQAEAHNGENVLKSLAYLPGSQYVEQQLNDRLQSDTSYALSAWVADAEAKSPLNSVRLMLFAGSTLLGSTDIQPTSADTWTNGGLVIETGDTHPQVGQFLRIRLMWGSNASYRVFVDDVSLTALPVVPPGPAIPAPVITSFSPAAGPIGTPVTITGKNFSAIPSSNSVFIGGVRVAVSSASTNSLLITVPAGAVLGPISVTANRRIGTSTVLFNPTFDGTFDVSFAPPVSFSVGNNPRSVVVADFNRDGISDLATANTYGDNLSVLNGTPTGGFGTPTNYPVGFQPLGVAVGDFNGDGFFDLVVASDHGTNSKVSLLLGSGNGGFSDASNYWVDDHPQGVAIGDFNGDGRTDLAVPAAAANCASVILGNGGGTLGIKTNFPVGQLPLGLAAADFNRDGIPDIAAANAQSNSISVLLAAGDGSFDSRTDYMFSTGPQAVVAGDFNGDGEPDLATIFGPNRASLLIGMGDGSFVNTPDFTVGDSPIRLAVCDFNGDGKQDLVIGYYGSNIVSVLLGMGNGTFSVKSDFSLGSVASTYGLAVGDFNRDGRPDIVAANNQENIVSLLLNTTTPAPLVFHSINPQSNGTVLLNMSSPRGKNVTIYASPDLVNWFPIVTLTNAQETLQFSDSSAGSFERRFYRAVAE